MHAQDEIYTMHRFKMTRVSYICVEMNGINLTLFYMYTLGGWINARCQVNGNSAFIGIAKWCSVILWITASGHNTITIVPRFVSATNVHDEG